jgi:predicted membrane protein
LTDAVDRGLRKIGITVSKPVLAAIAIIFGIVLIIFPALVGIIIGIFLIIQGILLLTDYMETSRQQTRSTRRTYTPPPEPPETPPAPPPTENP